MGVPKHGKNKGLRYTAWFLLKKQIVKFVPRYPSVGRWVRDGCGGGFGQAKRMFVNCRATSEGDVRNRIVTGVSIYIFFKTLVLLQSSEQNWNLKVIFRTATNVFHRMMALNVWITNISDISYLPSVIAWHKYLDFTRWSIKAVVWQSLTPIPKLA